MADKRKSGGVFDADPFGLGNSSDSFFDPIAQPRQASSSFPVPKPKTLTPKQQEKARTEAEVQQYVTEASNGIQQLRTSPEWLNASLDRRKELYNTWTKNKYLPMVEGLTNEDAKKALRILPSQLLYPDIAELARSIDEGPGQLRATGIGALRNVQRSGTQLIDNFINAPADDARFAVGLEEYRNKYGEYPKFGSKEYEDIESRSYENRMNSPVRQAYSNRDAMLQAARQQLASDSLRETPYYKSLIAEGISPESAYQEALDSAAKEKVAGDIRNILSQRLSENARKLEVAEQLDNEATQSQGAGQLDRNIQRGEDQQAYGAFAGTLRNAVRGNSLGPIPVPGANLLQTLGEQAGNIAPVVGAAAINPYAAIPVAAELQGADSVATAQQNIQRLNEQQLQTIPLYRQLRQSGLDEQQAKAALALQAGSSAELPGQILGAVTAVPGAEAILGTGLRTAISGSARAVAPTAGQAATRAAIGTGISGATEGANQLIANQSAQGVGAPVGTWDGVAEATAQGIVVGAPLAGGGAYLETRGARNTQNPLDPNSTAPTPTDGGTPPTDNGTAPTGGTPPTDGSTSPINNGPRQGDTVTVTLNGWQSDGIIASINPDGTVNVTSDSGVVTVSQDSVVVNNPPPVQSEPVPSTSIPPDVVQGLRSTLADIRNQTEPLTIPQREAILDQFVAAEQAGVPRAAIESGLNSIIGNSMDGVSLLDAYRQRVETNGNQTQTSGTDVARGSTINDGVSNTRTPDTTTAGDTGGVPTVNRGVEQTALPEQAGTATTEVTTDATGNGAVDTNTIVSRAEGNPTPETTINAETTEGLGGVSTDEGTNGGRYNQPVPNEAPTNDISQRSPEYADRSGPTDGGIYAGDATSPSRVNQLIAETTRNYDGVNFNPTTNEVTLSRTVNGQTTVVPMREATGGHSLSPELFTTDVSLTTPSGTITGRISNIAMGPDPVVYIRRGRDITPVRYSEIARLRIGNSVADTGNVTQALATETIPQGAEVSMRSPDGTLTNGTISSVTLGQDGRPVYGVRYVTPDGRVMQSGNVPAEQVIMNPTTMDEFASAPLYSDTIDTTPRQSDVRIEPTTPAGRDISSLQQAIDKFRDTRDDDTFLNLADLQSAIDLGDMATADSIADTLAASGRRDFMAPMEPTGQSVTRISEALRNLDDLERTAIRDAYNSIKGDLPSEFNSETAFNNAMIIDALQERSDAPAITPWYSRISDGAKEVFRKLAGLMAAFVIAIGINMGTPATDAVAGSLSTGPVASYTVGAIKDGQGVRGTSAETKVLNSWIRESNDNRGKNYIIADKQSGMIHIMDANGNVLNSSPALFGKASGDGTAYGQTPAGTFNLTHRRGFNQYGGDIQQFGTDSSGNIFAIHRVTTNKPSQKRLQRLASTDPADARISLGCINIPVDIYNKFLSKGFDGRLYIMPDQGRLTDTFAQFRTHDLAQQVYPNTKMPEDVGSSTNTNVETYTYNLANHVTSSIKSSDGLIGTVAAADLSGDIGSASFTNRGNDISDVVGWGVLGGVALLAARRIRRTRRDNRGDNNPPPPQPTPDRNLNGQDLPPPIPTDPLQPNIYNPRNVGSGGRDGTVWTGQVQQRNQGLNLVEQGARAGNWARMAFRDYQTPVVDFEFNAGLIPDNAEFDSGPLAQELKLSSSTRQNIAAGYQQAYVQPMIDVAARAAVRLSMDAPVAFDLMGTWRTMLHIPEANRVLRDRLVRARDEALLGEDTALANSTQRELDAFDNWQNGSSEVQVPTAGGLTDARADAIRRSIEGIGFTPDELNAYRGHVDGAIERIIQDRLAAGTLIQEEIDQWATNNFQNYVPLTVPKDTPTGDAFTGTSILNPAGDHAREGSMRLASSAGFAVVEFLNRTANDLAMVPVRRALYDVYAQLNERGDTHGLHAINIHNTRDPLYGEAMRTPGIIRTLREVQEDGSVRYRREKYFFSDPELSRALFDPPRPILAVQKAQNVTRSIFGLITKYQPLFPVKTYLPDVWERMYNLGNRKLLTESGERVSPARLRVKMVANLMNPMLYTQVALSMAGRHVGKFGEGARAVRELGGTTTYRDILRNQVSDIRKDINRSVGVRRVIKNLDNALLHWVEFWGEAAVTNTYVAMRDLGVAPRDAAYRTKDLLNFHNRGRYTNGLRAIKPFINATIEGNYNMVRSLKTSRGRYEAFGLVLAGMGLYALLRSMGPEDDDLGKKIDSLSIDELSRNIPLFTGDGDYAKIPVGFGMPQVSWTTAVALSRMADNIMTPAEATSAFALVTLKNVQPIDIPIDMAHDNPMAAFLQLITPSVLLPEAQLGMNRNAFGGRIHADSTFGKSAVDSGQARTSPLWTDVAKNIKSATGGLVDMYPESVRYLAQGHMMGPLSGLYTYWDKDSQITRPNTISAKQEAGPLLTAVGATYFMGNDSSLVSQRYYTYKDRAEAILKKYNVPATDDSNRGRPGAAGETAMGKLLAVGATMDEATLVRLVIDADKQLTKQKQVLSKTIKPYKNHDLSIDSLAPIFKATADEEESIMRGLIRQARGLKR